MDSKLNIENITNCLLTFQKLKQMYKQQENRKEGDEEVNSFKLDKLSLLQETITTISNFLPETRGGTLSSAFRQGSRYSSAYRGLKQQIRNMNGRNLELTQIVNAMKLVVPMLNSRHRVYMDKVCKIFEILQS